MCTLMLAHALKEFTGDMMLPTCPCVKVDELCVSGCSRVPHFLEGLPQPQNIGSIIVPEDSSRVILCPVYFTFCGVLSRKLDHKCVFVFGSKKTKLAGGSLFLFDSCEQSCWIWSQARRADLAFGSLLLTHD